MVMVGCLFVFITLLFKVAAAPFHFWSPDVYEGAPLSSTVIFSILPKLVIFNFFIKCISAFSQIFYEFQGLFLVTGLLSIFVGTFFALSQKRLKRLVIYSSIAQVGFLVSALATNTVDGFVSIYFFLFIYIITSVLIWGYITEFYSSQQEVNLFYNKAFSPIFLSSLSNYLKVNKIGAFSLMIVFFSVAGIPPLSGFLSKIFIIFGLVDSNFWLTSVVIVLISSISVFYYIRVVKVLFFESKDLKVNNQNIQTTFSVDLFDLYCIIMALGLYLLFFFFLFPEIPMLGSHYIVLSTFGF
jgi:proton-translocating NADH-quinone oxidoreductase chain N